MCRRFSRFLILECEIYGELTKEKIFVNPLALGSTSQHVLSLSRCDSTTPLIVGGEKTKNGEYPHMAAIGWKTLDGTLEFKCGGSLISERFVLTAAHCSRADGLAPSIVRLGDQNIKSQADGLTEVDIQIAEFIKHENYRRSSYYDDIAVIRLARNVEFTKYIRPACLWQTQNIASSSVIATGWGYTETAGQTSDELLKVELNIIDNNKCGKFFEDAKLDEGIIGTQMCAGILSGSRDTCNGGELIIDCFLSQTLINLLIQTLVDQFKSQHQTTSAYSTLLALHRLEVHFAVRRTHLVFTQESLLTLVGSKEKFGDEVFNSMFKLLLSIKTPVNSRSCTFIESTLFKFC